MQVIQSKIYEIRGQRVMLDRDLAELYGIETKRLKEAVRRNIERFEGEDFMVRLTPEEINELSRSQFATLNIGRGYNIKYAPFAFGELGVAMLSSVLKSTTAIEINRNIMRAFVAMKQFLIVPPESKIERLQNEMKELREYIEEAFTDYNDINEDTRMQIELINQALAELQVKNKEQIRKERPRIGFIRAEGGV
ncbi:ORF6N domain-containing protein [Odoribacter splanchnicus]|uniref:ORF6N domain-containing protein n=3 Tax=cellular organisms TaxID=131567 RepID=A0AAW6FH35_9BACT|nr:ORF6N domain-containing protein [Odoribacter splanchnicus]MDB9210430.1 ORF6N domain-containing protein [Odoribacter splanchnicus]MDB9223243.1 ORF6N domain-containing protein [Odoribacter splanchnicus]MDB9225842.1 ORF6N domain-containing protein [Odoribacter splanchnicus]MDB9236415.1 ORF6N domain-containing protein [Odoribacter splanchnicus]MDB9240575.1 ORF6N domain-containing protein [Odoribacter splanchnicus]